MKHEFFIVSVGHYDSLNQRYIRPLRIYASLSSAKRFVDKRRKECHSFFELDWYCIHSLNFDHIPHIKCFWVRDNGGDWFHGKD